MSAPNSPGEQGPDEMRCRTMWEAMRPPRTRGFRERTARGVATGVAPGACRPAPDMPYAGGGGGGGGTHRGPGRGRAAPGREASGGG
ncbi:hypothetical protein ADK34_31045, partial [Streptomyces viridochromogenes]